MLHPVTAPLKAHRPDMLVVPMLSDDKADERKRSFEYITASEQYCAAVIQQAEHISRLPSFEDYQGLPQKVGGGWGKRSGKYGGGRRARG